MLLLRVCIVVLIVLPGLVAALASTAPRRGLYALTQSVSGNNTPDSPAQLLTLSETTGEFEVVGPVVDAQGAPLWFSSVSGWPFYAGGAAEGGRTFAVLERPDSTAVLATIDLATGKAIETVELVDTKVIFGLFMISTVDGEPYGAVLRLVRQTSYIDVGPILTNGSVARQFSFTHFVLPSRVITGGQYFGFLRDDVGHDFVNVPDKSVVHVIGRECYDGGRLIRVAPGVARGPGGFVQPRSGAPFALISRRLGNGQEASSMFSLARLNDSAPPDTTRQCQIEWLIDIAPTEGLYLDQSAYDPKTNQLHVLLGKLLPHYSYALTSLVTIDVDKRTVRRVELSWPKAFRGGVRQLVYHV